MDFFTKILNEHAPLKTRSVNENHLTYKHPYLRTNMYKRDMLKNADKSERQNNNKRNKFKAQRNKSTSLRTLAIRDYFYQDANHVHQIRSNQ